MSNISKSRVSSNRSLRILRVLPVVALLLGGCNAFVGNIVVFGITFGIFVATLSLGRSAPNVARLDGAADASTSTSRT